MLKKEEFGDLVDRYIMYLDVKSQTKQVYHKILREFTKYVMTLSDLPTRSDIMAYREMLRTKKKRSSYTVQLYIVTIRNFYRWFHIEGYGPNAAEGIKGVKIDRSFAKHSLSVEASKKLLKRATYLSKKDILGIRNHALIALMITTGLRTIEVERADVKDIEYVDDMYILYIQGKGRDDKDTSVKLSPQVYKIIENYLILRNDDYEPLFINHRGPHKGERLKTRNIREIIKDRFIEVGIIGDKFSAHSLRHTTATLSLLEGANIEDTQQLLRHKDPATTQIYIHRMKQMKDSYENLISNRLFGPKDKR